MAGVEGAARDGRLYPGSNHVGTFNSDGEETKTFRHNASFDVRYVVEMPPTGNGRDMTMISVLECNGFAILWRRTMVGRADFFCPVGAGPKGMAVLAAVADDRHRLRTVMDPTGYEDARQVCAQTSRWRLDAIRRGEADPLHLNGILAMRAAGTKKIPDPAPQTPVVCATFHGAPVLWTSNVRLSIHAQRGNWKLLRAALHTCRTAADYANAFSGQNTVFMLSGGAVGAASPVAAADAIYVDDTDDAPTARGSKRTRNEPVDLDRLTPRFLWRRWVDGNIGDLTDNEAGALLEMLRTAWAFDPHSVSWAAELPANEAGAEFERARIRLGDHVMLIPARIRLYALCEFLARGDRKYLTILVSPFTALLDTLAPGTTDADAAAYLANVVDASDRLINDAGGFK